MYCVYCGRICDYHPSHYCIDCMIHARQNDRMVYILSLLKEAYAYVDNIQLREKIEKIVVL
jgi:hypothetical protein